MGRDVVAVRLPFETLQHFHVHDSAKPTANLQIVEIQIVVAPANVGPTRKARSAIEVCTALEAAYGSPRHGNPLDPLDDLVFILLSNRTGQVVAHRVYERLKDRFDTWDSILRTSDLDTILSEAGLASKRCQQLRGIVERLIRDFKVATLEPLAGWETEEAEAYLCSLPGVSNKVAKCVLMYTLGRKVLPVDTHVHRITKRLGWHSHTRADQSHGSLEAIVDPVHRYAFHTNCVAHGRQCCTARRPDCQECCLREYCAFGLDLKAIS